MKFEEFFLPERIMRQKLISELEEEGKVEINNDCIIFKRGNPSYVCLTAHTDTVLDPKIKTKINPRWYRANGVDDRAGCYCIYHIIKNTDEPLMALFTTGEELGGIGSSAVEINDDILYFIQFDMQSVDLCAFYDVYTQEFRDDVMRLLPEHRDVRGTFTDICIFGERFNRCGVNLSIGYFDNHSDHELLCLDGVDLAIKSGLILLKNMKKKYVLTPRKTISDDVSYSPEFLDWWKNYKHNIK